MRYFIVLFFFLCSYIFCQNCAYDQVVQKKILQNPHYEIAYKNLYQKVIDLVRPMSQETYYIPVVFHVVYNQDYQNLPDSVLESQIDVLNEDYRRLNENASETRDEFLEFAGDPNIEFFLANTDPNGNYTNGIVRKYTERVEFLMFEDVFSNEITLDEVKFSATDGSDAWDTNKYLNVWICNIGSLDVLGLELGQVYGYAYPPTNIDVALASLDNVIVPDWPVDMLSSDENVQGVVLHYTAVGRNNPFANDDGMTENNMGRAAVHEVAHYLGLRHIWGDALAFFGDDGCMVDDGIEDTPNASDQAGYVCDLNKNSCSGDNFGQSNVDLPDMVENYMDYSPGACQNLFTNGQINIMRTILEFSRPGLINNTPSINITEKNYNKFGKIIQKIDLLGRVNNDPKGFYLEIFDTGLVKKNIRISK